MRELRLDDDTFLDLSAQILRQGGSFQFRAHGSSMVPFIRDGDLLTVAPTDPAGLEIGNIVFFRTHRNRLLAHRLVCKSHQGGEWILEMQGDARLSSDRPVTGERVLGRVVRVQRDSRTYHPDRALWLRAARLWIRLLPVRSVLTRVMGTVTGAALSILEGLQPLGAYRRLALRAVGARARIRPAGTRDAASLGQLFGQETLPGVRQTIGALARNVAEEGGLALIATVGHRPAGAVALRSFPDDDPLYPGCWLLGPVVRARYRLAGIGRELLRRALEAAASQDIAWVYLLAYEDDGTTRTLAQEAGFLPASLPKLQARLDHPPWPGEPRRVVLGCALSDRRGPQG